LIATDVTQHSYPHHIFDNKRHDTKLVNQKGRWVMSMQDDEVIAEAEEHAAFETEASEVDQEADGEPEEAEDDDADGDDDEDEQG
jgi:hypothetical protein